MSRSKEKGTWLDQEEQISWKQLLTLQYSQLNSDIKCKLLLRNFFSRFYLRGSKDSVCPKLRNFVTESRKCQTLYANCEGYYSRRVMEVKDKNTLGNFIYCTVYFDGLHTLDNEQDLMKLEHVEQILDKMITVSKEFNLGGEIHLGVVWVYYFIYKSKTEKATPVFKIYKNKEGKEAVFLDISLSLYQSWDNYLDCCGFPSSFLCTPRNGDYYFLGADNGEDSRLDLEFLCLKNMITKKGNCFGASFARSLKPYSQIALRPWLHKIKDFSAEKIEEIKKILHILWNTMKKFKGTVFNAAVLGFLVWLKIRECENTMEEKLRILLMDGLMFLKTTITEGSGEDFLTLLTMSKIGKTLVPGLNDICKARETFTVLQSEIQCLVELSRKVQRDWVQILGTFCRIFRKCQTILLFLQEFHLPPVLQYLLLILSAVLKIQESYGLNTPGSSESGSKISGSQECENNLSLTSLNQICQQSDIVQLTKCSRETEESQQIINSMALEKSFSNLPLLENTSAVDTENCLIKDSISECLERFRKCPKDYPSTLFTLLLGEEDGYGIFVMSKASLPKLTLCVRQLIGREFSFKPRNTDVFDVTLSSGNIVGTLFFPLEFLPIGLFSLNAINKSEIKPLKLTESTQ